MRALLVITGVVAIAGCMVDFPEPVDAQPDASAGGSGGTTGGLGGAAGSAGAGGGGNAGVGGGGSAGVAGTAGTGGSAGTAGTAGAAGDAGGEPAGLVGYWPFDDGASNVAKDLAGNPPRDGSFTAGSISWASDAMFGTVLSFNEGTGVTMPAWNGGAFPLVGTVSVWVKVDLASVETKNRGIFDNYSATRSHVFIRRSNQDSGFPLNLHGAFIASDGDLISSHNVSVPNKTWKHVAIGWDTENDTGFYYVDGNFNPADLSSNPGWTPADQLFVFGQQLIGSLAEARLYDRVLSYTELQQVALLQNP